jgi:hypothetical protein
MEPNDTPKSSFESSSDKSIGPAIGIIIIILVVVIGGLYFFAQRMGKNKQVQNQEPTTTYSQTPVVDVQASGTVQAQVGQ